MSNFITIAKPSLKQAAAPSSAILSVLWFICDFIKPLEDLTPYLLMVSTVGFGIVLFRFRKRVKAEGLEKSFNSRLGGYLCFFALSIVVWIGLLFIFRITPPEGLAAATLPGLEDLQRRVLKIGQDVTEIKGTVGRIEEKIDLLAKSDTVISHPKTPEEFYVNARFFEVKGNTGEALKAYEKFLEMAPNYVDAHQAYQTLLNNTQGLEATRQIYASLQAKSPQNPVISLMAIRVLPDRGERIEKLKLIATQYPQFGPAFYDLAQEYLRPGPGNITIDEMKSAKEAYEQFKQADEKGGVKPYYIDKKVLDLVYRKKDEYDKMVTAFYGAMIDQPVEMRVEVLPNLVSVSIIPKEIRIKKIFYSIDDPNPTIDTGASPYIKDPSTGEPTPNYQVSGKVANGKHVLYAKYVNAQGKESRVFSYPFEVMPILARFTPQPGQLGSTSLNFSVVFQSIDGKNYDFFYSLDQPTPDKKVKGQELALEGLPAGNHELYYYGVSGGQKTETYHVMLSQ